MQPTSLTRQRRTTDPSLARQACMLCRFMHGHLGRRVAPTTVEPISPKSAPSRRPFSRKSARRHPVRASCIFVPSVSVAPSIFPHRLTLPRWQIPPTISRLRHAQAVLLCGLPGFAKCARPPVNDRSRAPRSPIEKCALRHANSCGCPTSVQALRSLTAGRSQLRSCIPSLFAAARDGLTGSRTHSAQESACGGAPFRVRRRTF